MIKILIIDDDDNQRLIIHRILTAKHKDFDVCEASNGEVGIELANEFKPNLIICDIIMPDMSGYNVLQRIRLNKATETTPFIFLTAKNDLTDLRRGMNLGADDYLVKPFEPQDLIQAVETRLKRFLGMKKHYENEIKPALKDLDQKLNYDSLTKLPNRFLLQKKFNQLLDNWYKDSTAIIPIIILKFINVKNVISKYGYELSDYFVQEIAKKLADFVGNDNIIAQLNYDEFAIILTPLPSQDVINTIVNSIIEANSNSIKILGRKIKITPQLKLGISLYPLDGKNLSNLLYKSEISLDEIAEQQWQHYQFYSENIGLKNKKNLLIENDLQTAIQNHELSMYYQIQINVKTGKIFGAESLIRWHHPQMSVIFPDQFLPIAEKNGYLSQIEDWVLESVCGQIRQFYYREFNSLNIAINLSLKQISRSDFNQKLIENLVKNDLTANNLMIEIKEDVLLENEPVIISRIEALRELGVKIALDDFGTGYSSLLYLQSFPLDIIKIDKYLIRDISNNPRHKSIIKSIIELAHNLNLKVIAEAVETQAEFETLVELDCDIIQGYYYSEPLIFKDFIQFLRNFQ